jgi:hypothetical protein
MKRLKLITICAVVGLLLITAAPATADDPCGPSWRGQLGTVYAHWSTWDVAHYSAPLAPDSWDSNPELTTSPYADADGAGWKGYKLGRYEVVGLTADNQLGFYMPNFGQNEHKDVWIQVTYYKGEQQYPLFTVNTGQQEVEKTPSVLEYSKVWGDGWVTDAWSFELWPNPAWENIGLNFSNYGGGGGNTWVDQVVIDTWCTTSVPEPTTISLLGLGVLSLIRRKRGA